MAADSATRPLLPAPLAPASWVLVNAVAGDWSRRVQSEGESAASELRQTRTCASLPHSLRQLRLIVQVLHDVVLATTLA